VYKPAGGVVDFIDITALVKKSKNHEGAIRKAQADIMVNGPGDPMPNQKVDFVDIRQTMDAFCGEATTPVRLPVTNPCP
jgi:hypothetical protein